MLRALLPSLIVITTSCAPILGVEETRYEAAEGECTLMPTRVFFADKLDENTQITVGAITQAELSELAIDVGTTLSPDRGHAVASILDCDGNPIEDADLDIEPTPNGETRFVIDGAGVQLGTDTSSLGLAGAFNLAATGELQLRALPAEIAPDPSSVGDIVPVAGELSVIVLRPNSDLTPPSVAPPPSLACVGTTSPPMTSEDSVTLTVTVIEAIELVPDGELFVGARVRACVDGQQACDVEATTNDDGVALLTVPVSANEGFDGQIVVDGVVPLCP